MRPASLGRDTGPMYGKLEDLEAQLKEAEKGKRTCAAWCNLADATSRLNRRGSEAESQQQ